MNRPNPIWLTPAALLVAMVTFAATAESASLKSQATVDDTQIRIGDLFYDAGANADTVVAQAPPPGRQIVLDARWLWRVAHHYKVEWRPTSRHDQAVVLRASRVIGPQRIAQTLASALREEVGVANDVEVSLDNRMIQFILPTDAADTIAIDTLTVDRRTNRFSAVVAAPADDPNAIRQSVTGQVHALVEVPVPVRRIRPGEVVRADDLQWMTVRADQIERDAFIDADGLIGLSPRRILMDGRPVRSADVRSPILVKKGDLVTIIYRTAAMRLTAQGKATENGAAGDSIRVQNMQSGKSIEATVEAVGTVAISTGERLASN